jgi:hypothetical protein
MIFEDWACGERVDLRASRADELRLLGDGVMGNPEVEEQTMSVLYTSAKASRPERDFGKKTNSNNGILQLWCAITVALVNTALIGIIMADALVVEVFTMHTQHK